MATSRSLGVGFVESLWVVGWVGEEGFGGYRVAMDWYGYLAFFELGLGGALLPLLARALGRNESGKVRDLLAAGVRGYLGIASAMLLAGLGITAFITRVIRVSPQNAADLLWGCLIGLTSLLWVPLASPFRAVTEARQRAYWINLLVMAHSLIIT